MVANAAIVGLGRWGQTIVASVEGKSAAIKFTAGVTRMHAKAAEIAAGGDDVCPYDARISIAPGRVRVDHPEGAIGKGRHIQAPGPFVQLFAW